MAAIVGVKTAVRAGFGSMTRKAHSRDCSIPQGVRRMSFSLPPTSTAPGRFMRGAGASIAIAGGLGLAVYYLTNRKTGRVPPAVSEMCAAAAEHLSDGAPALAAAQYEKAASYLVATSSEPIVLLDVLIRLGDAQLASEQYKAARDSFERANRLVRTLLSRLDPHVAAVNKLPLRLATTWDRCAEAAQLCGDSAAAFAAHAAAVQTVSDHFGTLMATAATYVPRDTSTTVHATGTDVTLHGSAVGVAVPSTTVNTAASARVLDARARATLSDIAGIFFNKAHAGMSQLEAAYSTDTDNDSAGVHNAVSVSDAVRHASTWVQDAATAVTCITAAHTAALEDCHAALTAAGAHTHAQLAARAIALRTPCHTAAAAAAARRPPHILSATDALALGQCCSTQRHEQPSDTLAICAGHLKSAAGNALFNELRSLWEAESAATSLLAEAIRVQAEHHTPTDATTSTV